MIDFGNVPMGNNTIKYYDDYIYHNYLNDIRSTYFVHLCPALRQLRIYPGSSICQTLL